MNPMNLMFSFIFAKSSAEKYNIADTQKLQNMALLSGMISTNPLLSYLLIENEAKNLSSVVSGDSSVPTTPSTPTNPGPIPPGNIIKCNYNFSELEKRIQEIVVGAIKDNISINCQTEKDPKVVELIAKINNDAFPSYKKQQIENLEKTKADFEIILSSPHLKKLSKNDLQLIEYLKELIISKGLLDSYIDLLNIVNSANQLNSYLIINVVLSVESKVSYLKDELVKHERESIAIISQTDSESISELSPKSTAKSTNKK